MEIIKILTEHGLETFLSNLRNQFATKSLATSTADGLMSANDKENWDIVMKGKELDGGTASTLEEDFLSSYDGGGASD